MLTQERLKELFTYCQESGKLKRLKNKRVACTMQTAGYIQVHVDKKLYLAQRLIFLYMNGEWPNGDVDHINHNRSDNRLSNLRIVSRSVNLRNARLSSRNSSGKIGVSFNTNSGKWVAIGSQNGIRKFLGYFETIDLAIAARSAWNEVFCHPNHGKR